MFEYNTISMRVLEKAGFEKEAVIKSSIIKEGKVLMNIYTVLEKREKRYSHSYYQ